MNTDECRDRADQCRAAAHYTIDRDTKRIWLHLADLWQMWSEQVDKFRVSEGTATGTESEAQSVRAAEPISKSLFPGGGEAAKMADQLRGKPFIPGEGAAAKMAEQLRSKTRVPGRAEAARMADQLRSMLALDGTNDV